MARLGQVLSLVTSTSEVPKISSHQAEGRGDESVLSWTTEAEADHSQTEASGRQLSWNMQGTHGRVMTPHLPRGSMCFQTLSIFCKGAFGFSSWCLEGGQSMLVA